MLTAEYKQKYYSLYVVMHKFPINKRRTGAEEDRLHEVALTVIKVANDPHLLSYPL